MTALYTTPTLLLMAACWAGLCVVLVRIIGVAVARREMRTLLGEVE